MLQENTVSFIVLLINPFKPTFGCIILQQEEVGGVTHRVLCTWQLPGLGAKGPCLALSGPILPLAACRGVENVILTFWGIHFLQGSLLGL